MSEPARTACYGIPRPRSLDVEVLGDVDDCRIRLGLPLDDLSFAVALQRRAELDLKYAVLAARDAGQTWRSIGDQLGVSPSAACQRFGR